jgi:hypothetical protein
MAKILVHREGKQMGPYEPEEARHLIYAGMLRENDLAWLEGTPSWVPLSALLVAPGSPQPTAQPAQLPATPAYYTYPATQASGLAIASLVLGILSLLGCLFFAAVPGVICGHLAISAIRRSQGRITGEGLALAGLITSYSAILITLLVLAAVVGVPMVPLILNR